MWFAKGTKTNTHTYIQAIRDKITKTYRDSVITYSLDLVMLRLTVPEVGVVVGVSGVVK